MAAPNVYYVNNGNASIPADEVGVLKVDHLPALFAYSGNQKSMFRLDGWITVQKGDGTGGNMGFIGFIRTNNVNSLNYRLHKIDKHGGVALQIDGYPIITLKDAGLNIYSYVEWKATQDRRANAIRVLTEIDIPFHNFNVDLVMAWSLYRGGVLIYVGEVSRTFNSSSQGAVGLEALISIIDSDKPQAGDEVSYTIRTSNDQGLWYDQNTPTFIVLPALVTWNTGTWASTAVSSPTGSYDLRFAKVPFVLGDTFYLNDIMGVTAPAGYYADYEKWYQLNSSGVLIDEGYHGQWPSGDPATPRDYTITTCYGYRASFFNITTGYLSNLIDYDAGTGWDTPFSIYLSTRADFTYLKYCSTTSLSGYVSNGYYVFPFGGGDRSTLLSSRYLYFVKIEDGSIIEKWEYDTIDQTSTQIPIT